MTTSSGQKILVFTGSYAEMEETGVCVYSLDPDNGELSRTDQQSGIKNPTFINVDVNRKLLYVIGESNHHGEKGGEIVTFAIDQEKGTLEELSRLQSSSSSTCHIQRDEEGQYLLLSSYHGGFVDLVALDSDGIPERLLDEHSHAAYQTSADQKPKAHSVFFSPDQHYLFAQDLGLDKVITYQIDTEAGKLMYQHDVELQQGAGPRHLVFHSSGEYAYVINELHSTVTAFRYISSEGRLEPVQTISTLPADYQGENGCAEIAISEDGRTLYGSNRGHDSIVVYRVHPEQGTLDPLQYISTEGGHPRHFSIMPGGRHLIVANRDGNNLVTYNIAQDGTLQFTGITASQSKPVCVKPAVFN
ncbi:lactonase family protein [Paenibacillus lemnae]|uniref:Lactonase family protein n=1 Tax=Paenibacillus lemnae TaxID=1330551 RepID=A0A848M6N9_PAELE|nr:lactonase family protein [Paenibacillus lemnae]NMO96296.1 lactonase family protein [Paenibacillus lemnae]